MSFCDSNGDGIGDIPGIISKLDYIKELGVDAIWLSPVYLSPNEDNGYDISDYYSINPEYGTMEDMDRLIAEADKKSLKIIMDLVINHTSDKHEWFQKSRQKVEPYTDFYVWKKGKNGKKPNNWGSFFGEDCWEYDALREEYYLHLFAKSQPDLNYRNENVISAVEDVMRFWLSRGVAGFRCDVINIIYKDSYENGRIRPALTGFEHYISTEGTHRILNRFNRNVFSKFNAFTVGETVFVTPKMADDLVNPERCELDTVFAFEHMETDCFKIKWFLRKFSPDRFFSTLTKWQNELYWNTVYFENHDQPRSVSRFGNDEKYHKRSAKALATLLLTLRGTAFIYEGQEIGMTNFDFTDITELRDVESKNIWALSGKLRFPKFLRWKMIKEKSRDNARTPMQWDDSGGAGFTNAVAWLGINSNYKTINVKIQESDPDSVLSYYKELLILRKHSGALNSGSFKEIYRKNAVYAYERQYKNERLTIIINLSSKKKKSPIIGKTIISSTGNKEISSHLAPYEAAILIT
ncbi:MAG: alpha-glucosidase [Ruminococcaceae bacterium]|nr:alpha-glucosidase [Oscillospiraceae bacterium]